MPSLNLDSIDISADDPDEVFEELELISRGNHGSVVRARHLARDEIVAIKKVLLKDESEIEAIVREVVLLRKCHHRNIVRYLGAYKSLSHLWIVMEYCDAGSLDAVYTTLGHPLPEKLIAYTCHEILQGLAYLHAHKIWHRDIKASNILLTQDGQVKLADFGVSTELAHSMSRRNTFTGTLLWMSPESIQQADHDDRADVWSLGITVLEMANGAPPRMDIPAPRVAFVIAWEEPPALPRHRGWSAAMQSFVRRLLTKDKLYRPSAATMLGDAFVQSVGNNHHHRHSDDNRNKHDKNEADHGSNRAAAEMRRFMTALCQRRARRGGDDVRRRHPRDGNVSRRDRREAATAARPPPVRCPLMSKQETRTRRVGQRSEPSHRTWTRSCLSSACDASRSSSSSSSSSSLAESGVKENRRRLSHAHSAGQRANDDAAFVDKEDALASSSLWAMTNSYCGIGSRFGYTHASTLALRADCMRASAGVSVLARTWPPSSAMIKPCVLRGTACVCGRRAFIHRRNQASRCCCFGGSYSSSKKAHEVRASAESRMAKEMHVLGNEESTSRMDRVALRAETAMHARHACGVTEEVSACPAPAASPPPVPVRDATPALPLIRPEELSFEYLGDEDGEDEETGGEAVSLHRLAELLHVRAPDLSRTRRSARKSSALCRGRVDEEEYKDTMREPRHVMQITRTLQRSVQYCAQLPQERVLTKEEAAQASLLHYKHGTWLRAIYRVTTPDVTL